jgi:hypothetical protein
MRFHRAPIVVKLALLAVGLLTTSCGRAPVRPQARPDDPELKTRGTTEITARLVEVPDGAIFKRDLYDYATVLKYQVQKVHRGELKGDTVYVGHYDPWKPRGQAADRRVKDVGGDLRQFRAGQVHHMALDGPIEDVFMGGIVNKYFGQDTGTIYWAVWTDLAGE